MEDSVGRRLVLALAAVLVSSMLPACGAGANRGLASPGAAGLRSASVPRAVANPPGEPADANALRTFTVMDLNGDNAVIRAEYPTAASVPDFAMLDLDADRKIELPEWRAYLRAAHVGSYWLSFDIPAGFKVADADHNGKLVPAEVDGWFKSLPSALRRELGLDRESAAAWVTRADRDHDIALSGKEVDALMGARMLERFASGDDMLLDPLPGPTI